MLWRTDRNKSRRTKALTLLYIIHPFSHFSQITFSSNTSASKYIMNILTEILGRAGLLLTFDYNANISISQFSFLRISEMVEKDRSADVISI